MSCVTPGSTSGRFDSPWHLARRQDRESAGVLSSEMICVLLAVRELSFKGVIRGPPPSSPVTLQSRASQTSRSGQPSRVTRLIAGLLIMTRISRVNTLRAAEENFGVFQNFSTRLCFFFPPYTSMGAFYAFIFLKIFTTTGVTLI